MNVPPNKIQNGRGMPWVMLAHHPCRAAGSTSTWSTSRVSMSRTLAAGTDRKPGRRRPAIVKKPTVRMVLGADTDRPDSALDSGYRWSRIKPRTRSPDGSGISPLTRAAGGPGSATGLGLQALQDQLPNPGRVGLAASGLHDRADQRAGGRDLAGADLVGDVGIGGNRFVDGRS